MAAMLPEELTWNCEDDPTLKRAGGAVVPIPMFLLEILALVLEKLVICLDNIKESEMNLLGF